MQNEKGVDEMQSCASFFTISSRTPFFLLNIWKNFPGLKRNPPQKRENISSEQQEKYDFVNS